MTVEVSTIIPTFRRPAQLRAAALSVLAQEKAAVELIVIDDSPEGSAREVVETLNDARVTYILNPKPTGGAPSKVRNMGLPRASGKYVHFLDDDDIVPEGHYRAVTRAFADNPDVGLVFGHIEPFGDCPPEQLAHERRYFRAAARKAAVCQRLGRKFGFASEMLFGSAMLVCSAAVMRRDCAVRLNGFDPEIRLMEDADFNLRMMREFGALFLDQTVLRYRIGSPSLLHNPDPDPAQRAEERACIRKFRNKYRLDRGAIEFYALALLCRGVLRFAS